MTVPPTVRWIGLALLGLAIAAGVAIAASSLASQQIGLASEPISAGDTLAPARHEVQRTARHRRSDRHRLAPSTTATTTEATPTETAPVAPPAATTTVPPNAGEARPPAATTETAAPPAPSRSLGGGSEGGDDSGGGGGSGAEGGPDD